MRFHLGWGSKARRFFLYSPAKEKAANGGNPVGEFGFKSKPVVDSGFGYPDFGSKEEMFFDSKVWLDSDCEDDFFSVNGDFTPSRGSTPKHHFSTPGTPLMNKSLNLTTFPGTALEPSPTDGKKRLFDLLQETFHEHVAGDQNAETNGKTDGYKPTDNQPLRSEGSPYLSGTNSVWSSEATPGRDPNNRKERTWRPKHCCFPGFVPRLSFSDRRKLKMSPARQTESG